MKKTLYVGSLICLVLLLGGMVSGSSGPVDSDDGTMSAYGDRTFLSGMVVNPVLENNTVSASALQLFYYNPGIFVDQVGVVRGLTTVSFTKGNFILVWTPGPFELVGYVIGFCSDFEIHE